MAAALVAAGMLAWRAVRQNMDRRHMLECGQIRELSDLWLDVNGCRLYARFSAAAGSHALPVILVHGWGISSSYFIPAAERLAASFAVFAPDLPGHGKSDTPREPLDIGGMAQALLDWMDCAGIAQASLVGHSMGCQIVAEAALRQPQRVSRLVLIGPTWDPEASSLLEHFRRLLVGGAYERHSLSRHLIRDYWRMGRRLWPELKAMMHDPVAAKLPRITVPVMLVRGEKDPIAPQRWFMQAARQLGTDRMAVIPRWGHAVQYSDPVSLVSAIHPFIAAGRPEIRNAGTARRTLPGCD